MKTKRENSTKLFLMAICLSGLFITSSCIKPEDIAKCADGNDKDCEDIVVTPYPTTGTNDSTAAVAKLPVRVETEE